MTSYAADSLAPSALAAGIWSLVTEATTVRFTVRDKLVATVAGTVPVLSGSVTIGSDGGASNVRVELDAAGVDTRNARRDKDLRGARFLNVLEHPTMVVDAGPAAAGPSGWQLEAGLTARGSHCAVPLDVVLLGGDGAGVRARVTGRLDRSGLGIRVPSFIVGRYVDLEVMAVFHAPS
jgi:polyisoprenoid-binding protein YceI